MVVMLPTLPASRWTSPFWQSPLLEWLAMLDVEGGDDTLPIRTNEDWTIKSNPGGLVYPAAAGLEAAGLLARPGCGAAYLADAGRIST